MAVGSFLLAFEPEKMVSCSLPIVSNRFRFHGRKEEVTSEKSRILRIIFGGVTLQLKLIVVDQSLCWLMIYGNDIHLSIDIGVRLWGRALIINALDLDRKITTIESLRYLTVVSL